MTAPPGWAEQLRRAVAAEFSDVPDIDQATRIIVRLSLASVLGFALGLEREAHGKAAGLRTHMLVALGSALFVLLPLQMGMAIADVSRIVQGLVAGVGFLCAGTILKQHGQDGVAGEAVQGLTTAAGLWVTAAIGCACGLGREVTALIATLLVLLVMAVVPRVAPNGMREDGAAPPTRAPGGDIERAGQDDVPRR